MKPDFGAIRIIADDEDEVKFKGAVPSLQELGARVHEVSADVLQRNLATLMGRVESMFSSSTAAMKTLSVKEVKVSVAVNGAGEFSLLGLTKASADLKATFEITFTPKV
ncbi:hypothetical protein L2449_09410 [Mesorhizobium muleiense]|uniref:Pepco domain-containing protein n=1 Tax=Mesorhizobium muleiense TaxID=1004279 RepID=UPI001F254CD3|nr:hypothetical protein [Mesorhizobium muleiense]MCF6117130.1 hypothetical protein [Mesorhizobium muleiense]